ncbi:MULTISPECIES: RNA polymerase sigma factor [Niastella]|uniref:Sigma-70 family RNA polymerase sigma factor n=1 Tax=Niastella soli TaxID=2821487 RepID=A0ABS3Z3N6_9BACT|nr:sigma-70 family RNA polymerase sigma factor [Niastella soli]MBO9204779.1 sigma-70 family RNA polymerase sigma factor [Niastella soli]
MLTSGPILPDEERALLVQLQTGSGAAFTLLYQAYAERLYYNILALVKDELTAEELVQDIFSRIWQKRETIQIDTSFGAYLFAASRNRVYDFFRKLDRDHHLYATIKAAASYEYSYIEEALLNRENADILQKAIRSLPQQRRRAFELCKIEGCSYKEASEIMGISLSTLKDHMANAREAIRTYVSKHYEITTISVALFYLWDRK